MQILYIFAHTYSSTRAALTFMHAHTYTKPEQLFMSIRIEKRYEYEMQKHTYIHAAQAYTKLHGLFILRARTALTQKRRNMHAYT